MPMMISALIHTFFPDLFNIGGVTESFFGPSSLGFIFGATIFISGCTVKLSSIKSVIKIYGLLIFSKNSSSCFVYNIILQIFRNERNLGNKFDRIYLYNYIAKSFIVLSDYGRLWR